MTMRVSVVMTAYNRSPQIANTLASIYRQTGKELPAEELEVIVVEDGDDGGKTRAACEPFPVRYFQRKNRPALPYSNPAAPNNIGLRRASGNVVILQNAENMHVAERAILDLIAPVEKYPMTTTFASVRALNQDGTPGPWYCHPTENSRPLYFCQALRREHVERLRGFDEDFVYYGYDDDDFAARLAYIGVKFKFTNILVHHQWHGYAQGYINNTKTNMQMFNEKTVAMHAGRIGPERNLGREWGSIDS